MNKEKKIVFIFVIIAVLLVAGFMVLWQFSTANIHTSTGSSYGENPRVVTTDIEMIDSNGESKRLMDLRGKVWLISHVFTRCPGQCAGVCVVLDEIRQELRQEENFHLVSVTLDPNHDSPSHLKDFSKKHGFDSKDWWFLTGKTNELNDYMMQVFSLSAQEKEDSEKVNPDDLFAHKPMVALVDHELKIRGWFNPFDKSSSKALRRQLLLSLNESKS